METAMEEDNKKSRIQKKGSPPIHVRMDSAFVSRRTSPPYGKEPVYMGIDEFFKCIGDEETTETAPPATVHRINDLEEIKRLENSILNTSSADGVSDEKEKRLNILSKLNLKKIFLANDTKLAEESDSLTECYAPTHESTHGRERYYESGYRSRTMNDQQTSERSPGYTIAERQYIPTSDVTYTNFGRSPPYSRYASSTNTNGCRNNIITSSFPSSHHPPPSSSSSYRISQADIALIVQSKLRGRPVAYNREQETEILDDADVDVVGRDESREQEFIDDENTISGESGESGSAKYDSDGSCDSEVFNIDGALVETKDVAESLHVLNSAGDSANGINSSGLQMNVTGASTGDSTSGVKKRGGGKLGRRRKRGYIYDPKPLIPKTKTNTFPSDMKDADYWHRRQRNNEAAKRSRENRRVKELETMSLVKRLTDSNEELKDKIQDLELKNKFLEQLLKRSQTPPINDSGGSAASSDNPY